MKHNILFLIIPFAFMASSYSQEDDTGAFIDDMLLLAGNFAQPAADGVGYQNSAGWFSSAASLAPWDLRFSVQGNALFVPAGKKRFRLQQSELRLLQIEDGNSADLPTAFGGTTGVHFSGDISFRNPLNNQLESQEIRFKGFDGVNRNFIPHAFAQLAIGLPYQTEITFRGIPEITINDVASSTIGIGLKHSLSQYFSRNGEEEFQVALAAAYSRLQVEYEFNPIEVEKYLLMELIGVDADLFMAEVIGSRRWGAFEPFAALGLVDSKFNYEIGGGGLALDRVNAEIDGLADSETSLKADFGFNLHYERFRFSTMATVGEFFNANIGLHIRI